ncbi:signal peptidase II [Xinfangfangia pollutisoli]|uniref:signal peptidase II n=1 Tax=Xinfangfangia pollutisoli TaxID=2865960 RepID=UPI001CD63854|nr:signal peptidase II [Xinfangfangia pollutisoli]
MRIALLAAALTLAADQVSKVLIVHGLDLRNRGEIDVLPPFLNFRMAWNRGINFGLFTGEGDLTRWLLIAVALVISAWVWLWVRRTTPSALVQVSAGILIGGALGNVIDRLAYGAVADFLNMSCCGIENPFAFNIADIAIFAGAFGLVLFAGGPARGAGNPPKRGKRDRKTP